jgi:hypothetical protein
MFSRWGVWVGMGEHNIALARFAYSNIYRNCPKGEQGGIEGWREGRLQVRKRLTRLTTFITHNIAHGFTQMMGVVDMSTKS